MAEQPVIQKQRGVSIVWSLPLLALCICGWLLYSSYQSRGTDITIYFDDATGIIGGKTQVIAKGIPIGVVKKIHPDLTNNRVKAIIKIDQQAEEYLVEGTIFWIVRPQLSASSVQGLDTILSGNYIDIQVGSSTVPQYEFVGLSTSPPKPIDTPGLHIQLKAEKLGSIQVGTGIYYRNIEIGNVQQYQLVGDENILIDLFIEPEYSHLVQTESRFCNVSGIQIAGKLPNLKIQIESLASILKGGILLHTPKQLQNSPKAVNGTVFTLYPDYESANYGLPMTLRLASSENIIEGATKVMYRGLEAGFVKEIQFNNDKERSVTAHILLDPRAELILRENTSFWIVKPEFRPSGIKNMGMLLSGPHITFQPGDGEFSDHFEILPEPPPQNPLRPGKPFTLISHSPVALSLNSPVYFMNINVGEIINVDLGATGKSIKTTIFIYEKFLRLLSNNSIFWIHEGVEMEASFAGVELSTGPLARLIYGGISFSTPDKSLLKNSALPIESSEFILYNSQKEALDSVVELQRPGKRVLIISENAESLSIGAPILHKNIQIGSIENITFTPTQQEVLIECSVEESFTNLIHSQTRFYNTSGIQVTGGLSGIKVKTGSLQSIISGGIGCINLPGEKTPTSDGDTHYPLYSSLTEARQMNEFELTVHFDNPQGVQKDSPVKYKGITVGKVTTMTFSDDLKSITAKVQVAAHFAKLFRKQTQIWVEKAEINISKVKNLDTIIFGPFLTFLPGEGLPTSIFHALPSPPYSLIASRTNGGLGLVLETSHLGSLTVGSPVYYRQVQVGEVTGHQLSPSFGKVYVFITIDSQYNAIIRDNTKFWNVSGARIEGGLFSGITVSTESLTAIMKGGIALATPGNEKIGHIAFPGQHFPLYEKSQKLWLDWSPDLILLEEEDRGNFETERR